MPKCKEGKEKITLFWSTLLQSEQHKYEDEWFIKVSLLWSSQRKGIESVLLVDYKWPWPVLLLHYFIICFMHQWVGLEMRREPGKHNSPARNWSHLKTLGIKPPISRPIEVHVQWLHLFLAIAIHFSVPLQYIIVQLHVPRVLKLQKSIFLYEQ